MTHKIIKNARRDIVVGGPFVIGVKKEHSVPFQPSGAARINP
jgi:hypothetical protein